MYSLLKRCGERDKPHFSIVELLIVVVALAIVASILLPKMLGANTRTKEDSLRSDLRMLRDAIDAFHTDTGRYPASLSDLGKTDVTSVEVAGGISVNKADWHGPYVQEVPHDPVSGGAFRYADTTGIVSSATSGPALDGTAYNSW